MSGFPVHHQLLEFTQIHVHQVSDAIQPSHPLSPPSPPTFNLSQHQGLFQRVSSSYQVAKKYWSFSFSISPSNEYSGLISFRILLAWCHAINTVLSFLQSSVNRLALLCREEQIRLVQKQLKDITCLLLFTAVL